MDEEPVSQPIMTISAHKYTTFYGIPLAFDLRFPFHASSAGADWHVLHGTITLEDGSGLLAEVAVQMSAAVRGVLPSLEPADTLGIAINSIRKMVDTRDMEFLKSSKKQPVHMNSRVYSVVDKKWTFHQASDAELVEFLRAKAFWRDRAGAREFSVTDPIEQLYLGATSARLLAAAQTLAASGELAVTGETAAATARLKDQAAAMESKTRKVLDELNAKHQFERETQKA